MIAFWSAEHGGITSRSSSRSPRWSSDDLPPVWTSARCPPSLDARSDCRYAATAADHKHRRENRPMADLKLKTVTRTQGNNQALKDGTVKPKTFEFDFEEVDPIIAAFRRMVRGNEFDICEMAITTYICAKRARQADDRDPGVHRARLPPRRHPGQHQGRHRAARRTSRASGSASTAATRSPPASGRAACCRTSTASISARSPGCCPATSTSPSTSRPRTSCRSSPARRWRTCWRRANSPPPSASTSKSPDVKPLIPNALEAGLAALRQRGHYPINHHGRDQGRAARRPSGPRGRRVRRLRAVEAALCRAPQGRPDREADRGRRDASARHGDHRRSVALRHRRQPQGARRTDRARADAGHHRPARSRADELFHPSTRGLQDVLPR